MTTKDEGPVAAEIPAGRAAEESVAALYRALGYEVRRDVLIDGNQIDVVARQRVPGFDLIRICIEVKDHPGRALPIKEVRDFITVANLLVASGRCERVHLVTTGTITRNSRLAVAPFPALKIQTYSELECQVFSPETSLGQWLQSYRESPVNVSYVDLQATLIDYEVAGRVEALGQLRASNLVDVALAHPTSGMILFGDYGAGKTTVLNRLKAAAIERHATDAGSVIPLFVPLRNLTGGMDAEQLALQALRTEFGFPLPPATFWSLLDSGRFLVLLDGFDEITLRADAEKRAALLAEISPLLFGASPAIITSRPSYFASAAEYKSQLKALRLGGRPPLRHGGADPGAERLDRFAVQLSDRYVEAGPGSARDAQFISYRLDPLTGDQIDEFLNHVAPALASEAETTPAEVRQLLDGIYDLSDLITRPIILDMAVVSVLKGQIDPSRKTLANGPAGLYEAYTRVKLDIDWRKAASRRELLTPIVHGNSLAGWAWIGCALGV